MGNSKTLGLTCLLVAVDERTFFPCPEIFSHQHLKGCSCRDFSYLTHATFCAVSCCLIGWLSLALVVLLPVEDGSYTVCKFFP